MPSMETLLNARRGSAVSLHDWSVVWSTTHIPGMDTAHGGWRDRMAGRRQLRLAAMLLASCLAVHCRVVSAVISGGGFTFALFLTLSVFVLANPLRHFELFLGQWSLSGPGRAFRYIPLLDGIGLAIAVTCLIRAIVFCCMAAMALVYVGHAISDERLPFKYCRDFNLKRYEPLQVERMTTDFKGKSRLKRFLEANNDPKKLYDANSESIGNGTTQLHGCSNNTVTGECYCSNETRRSFIRPPPTLTETAAQYAKRSNKSVQPVKMLECKENFTAGYPMVLQTPAYNFFYVEVMRLQPDLRYGGWNTQLLPVVGAGWLFVWALMLLEKLHFGKLVWNNAHGWMVGIPFVWVMLLLVVSVSNVSLVHKQEFLEDFFELDSHQTFVTFADSLEVSMYIHAAGAGTEIILGKGLNHYAQGHIDAQLNYDNLVQSLVVSLLVVVHSVAGVCCAAAEPSQPPDSLPAMHQLGGSTLWVLPMYSKCVTMGTYSHFFTAVVFGGLTAAYMVASYIFLKTALHCLFEYKVKLVFYEQQIVFVLVALCMCSSLVFMTSGGLVALEAVDMVTSGLVVPLICLLELVALLYVYSSTDFISDMLVSTEENACSTRISTMWKIIPLVTTLALVVKIVVIVYAVVPQTYLLSAMAPLALALFAVFARAAYNALRFLRNTRAERTRTRT